MSLINQMLQDLEARGKQGQTVSPMPNEVRPVVPPPRTGQMWMLVLGLALLLLVLVIWMVPRQNQASMGTSAPRIAVGPVDPASNPKPPVPQVVASPVVTSPAVASPAVSSPAVSTSMPPASNPLPATPAPEAGPAQAVKPADRDPLILKLIPELTSLTRPDQLTPRETGKPVTTIAAATPARPATAASVSPATSESVSPASPATSMPQANLPRQPVSGDSAIKLSRQPLTPQQRAENEYRKATHAHQNGRTQEAIGHLEQALQVDHQHTAARQAMVAWLLELGQRAQAMQKLQEGLGHDPAQSGLAMILARLQVDQGDVKAALETLNRSLPYTLGRADYQAFMAALLQREARHKEAILRYQNALAIDPDKAVWWMGIGISLQAEQQKAAARESFSRARGIGGLSPELQAFVEQRISQLQ